MKNMDYLGALVSHTHTDMSISLSPMPNRLSLMIFEIHTDIKINKCPQFKEENYCISILESKLFAINIMENNNEKLYSFALCLKER